MPIYEYRCPKCGHFEHEQPITARALRACPRCGQPVKKLISRSAVIFKGSGFYVTDNRKPDYKERSTLDGGGLSESTSNGKSGGDSAKQAAGV